MSDMIIENLKNELEKEKIRRSDVLFVVDKVEARKEKDNIKSINLLKSNQRVNLTKFLNKYKPNETLLVRCKEDSQIGNLYFKKDNYYVFTFAGILKTYEEVPFYIHDIRVTRKNDEEAIYVNRHDGFRVKTKYLFKVFEFIKSVAMNECRENEKFKYVYFNYEKVLNDCDVIDIFPNQLSVYDKNETGIFILKLKYGTRIISNNRSGFGL